MMTKHDEFDDFFGDDEDTPVADTRAAGRLLRVPLNRLAPNDVNPRTDFGTEAELLDLGKSLHRRQIQACPAVSRSAYLKLWPDHAEQIGDVDYVLVAGERRYRGADAAGNPNLDCVVDDGLAKDRKTFVEAVVSENVDRQNFDPVEEAYAVQALVTEFGSNRAVAQHFERVDGWVTQRILLTHLAPEVQELVRKKAMPLEAARSLGKLARDNQWDPAKQLAWWQDEQEQRAAASAERSAAKKAAKKAAVSAPLTGESAAGPDQPGADPFYGRKTDQANPAPAEPAPTEQDAPASAGQSSAPAVPGQASPAETTREQQPKPFPYEDGAAAARYLIHTMPTDEFDKMLDLLNKHSEAVPVG
ncbi:ParB/RepB/Spo0J family partition protein [Kitasatospora sp. NPDC052868]|uniref:ParB/RepB/Spo0J family partition protein n=1 Tax=Kitasatospora sp. NPDC052868 TaxID=3364060 RepID=UPI0037C7D12C